MFSRSMRYRNDWLLEPAQSRNIERGERGADAHEVRHPCGSNRPWGAGIFHHVPRRETQSGHGAAVAVAREGPRESW
eukprot:6825379-Pyramimonas_sp.AAC.1